MKSRFLFIKILFYELQKLLHEWLKRNIFTLMRWIAFPTDLKLALKYKLELCLNIIYVDFFFFFWSNLLILSFRRLWNDDLWCLQIVMNHSSKPKDILYDEIKQKKTGNTDIKKPEPVMFGIFSHTSSVCRDGSTIGWIAKKSCRHSWSPVEESYWLWWSSPFLHL